MADTRDTPTTIAGLFGVIVLTALAYLRGKSDGEKDGDNTIRHKDAHIDLLLAENKKLEKSEASLKNDLHSATKPQIISVSDKVEEVDNIRRELESSQQTRRIQRKSETRRKRNPHTSSEYYVRPLNSWRTYEWASQHPDASRYSQNSSTQRLTTSLKFTFELKQPIHGQSNESKLLLMES